MFKEVGSKFKRQISQIRDSLTEKSPPAGERSPTANAPQSRRFLPKLPPQLTALSQNTAAILKRAVSVRHRPNFWLFLGLGVGISSGAIALGYGIYKLESSITESVADILTYERPETLTIQASDGTILREIGPVTHEKLKNWQIPAPVVQAFIASEDRRFQNHRGVDLQGITRAAFSNLQAGEVVEGGSTITQQLARLVFLNQERSYTRKFKEMRLAQKIENTFSKDKILERYLNLVYLGSGAYGIADAAWVYFGKSADQLTASEAATLAGIVPAPSLYSPLKDQAAATARRNLVLGRMAEDGFISQQQADSAIASPLKLNPKAPKRLQSLAPYFTDYVQQELPKLVSKGQLNAGGITVETTLNPQWQKAAEKAIDTAVNRYGTWQGYQQAALVAVDPRNGQIKVMVGGNDYAKNQFNRVTQAKRQPGSTFKTFVYSTAIAAGFSPDRSFMNAEYTVDGYKPENFGDSYTGQAVTMRQAIASSLNVVAVQVLVKVGWNPVIRVAKRMGIESELQPTYSLALGSWEVTPLELTSAYGTLANQGIHQSAYGISRVLDRQGNVLYQAPAKPEPAIDPTTSAIMTWMLQGVVTSGTGTAAQIGRPAAGKTGTSDKARDLWFVGYVPQLAAGVWLGNDNNRPTSGASVTAAAIWRQFMLTAIKDLPYVPFPTLPQLDGRKGSLKAEPLKPRRTSFTVPKRSDDPTQQVNPQGSEQTQPRRRRRRRNSSEQTYAPQGQQSYATRRSAPAASEPQPTAPAASAEPATAPVVDSSLPAPPAARKAE